MALIEKTGVIKVGYELIDNDHDEFISLLNQLDAAGNADFPVLFQQLYEHTEQYFDRGKSVDEAIWLFLLTSLKLVNRQENNAWRQHKQLMCCRLWNKKTKNIENWRKAYINPNALIKQTFTIIQCWDSLQVQPDPCV